MWNVSGAHKSGKGGRCASSEVRPSPHVCSRGLSRTETPRLPAIRCAVWERYLWLTTFCYSNLANKKSDESAGRKDVCGSPGEERHNGRPKTSSWLLCMVFLSLLGPIIPTGTSDIYCGVGYARDIPREGFRRANLGTSQPQGRV